MGSSYSISAYTNQTCHFHHIIIAFSICEPYRIWLHQPYDMQICADEHLLTWNKCKRTTTFVPPNSTLASPPPSPELSHDASSQCQMKADKELLQCYSKANRRVEETSKNLLRGAATLGILGGLGLKGQTLRIHSLGSRRKSRAI